MTKHRKPRKRWIAPAAVAAGISTTAMLGSGIAQAAPESGWSNPNPTDTAPESGWSNPNPTPTPEPAPAPAPAPVERPTWTPPPVEYQEIEWRQAPAYQQPSYSGNGNSGYSEPYYGAPIQIQNLHLPVAVDPVAPIEAPPEMLRLGDYTGERPRWMSTEYMERTNNEAALAEARMATFWKSVGVDVERSDRVAAATVGAAAAGAAAAALPAAGVGALIGGHVGGNIGLGLGGFVSVPLPPPLPVGVVVPTTVAGTAIGAAAGAAIAAVPAAVVGGIGGAAVGAAVGAGDTLAEPRVIEIPDLPEHDLDGITTQVSEQLAAAPEPVAQAVTGAVEAVPQFVEDVTAGAVAAREAVLAQPGGDQVISALDAAAAEAQLAFGPTAEWVGEALGAAQSGVTEA